MNVKDGIFSQRMCHKPIEGEKKEGKKKSIF
jgi:hypothetical protein